MYSHLFAVTNHDHLVAYRYYHSNFIAQPKEICWYCSLESLLTLHAVTQQAVGC